MKEATGIFPELRHRKPTSGMAAVKGQDRAVEHELRGVLTPQHYS
jgi:hypothetical protein